MPQVATLDISCAVGDSDLNRALIDGRSAIQAVDLHCVTLSSPERHWRMFQRQEFDIAEVSFGAYLSAHANSPGEFVAVPAFPHRRFRHSYVFVGHDSALRSPAELADKRVGLRTWTNSAGVWTRGIVQDQYGVDLSSIEWVLQDPDTGGDDTLPDAYHITRIESGRSIVDLSARGELDALIYPEVPDVLDESGGLRRILANPREEEIAYFRSTGIFPIMHVVALRREIVDRYPWLAYETLRAFRVSKSHALVDVRDPRKTCLAWARDTYEHQVELMGSDPWGYDVWAARTAIDTFVRYAVEQGILERPVPVSELFHPATLDEPPNYVRR